MDRDPRKRGPGRRRRGARPVPSPPGLARRSARWGRPCLLAAAVPAALLLATPTLPPPAGTAPVSFPQAAGEPTAAGAPSSAVAGAPSSAVAGAPRVPIAPPPGEEEEWVDETLERLDLREKAAQLIWVWTTGGYASETDGEWVRLSGLVEELGIGGLVISVGLPDAYVARLNGLQERADVPLLVASDFESGAGMRLGGIYSLPSLLDMGGATEFPPAMAFGAIGDPRFAREAGRVTGLEARALGVHLAFAPVVDVNSDPENPVINTRSFGEDPRAVGRLGEAFIRGAREAGLLTTAKHYPGHGDTRVDSHLEIAVVGADRARLDSVELVPFRRAISAGVDAVMTAHVAAPEILGPEAPPATLSPFFMSALLRGELGFGGLVFTDAMDMGAIVQRYGTGDAAVRAIRSGADVILMPPDPAAAVDALAAAVRAGELTERRLDASVRRLLELKARAGLHRERRVDPDGVRRVVGTAAHRALADSAAVRSLVLPRDREGRIPLDRAATRRVLSVTFAREANLAAGRVFDRRLAAGGLSVRSLRLDPSSGSAAYDSVRRAAASADLTVLSVHVPPRAAAGSVDVPDALAALGRELLDGRRSAVLLSFGSPYLLSRFPGAGTYLLAWGSAAASQRAAAAALLGEASVTGRLPISLPPFHRLGEGLRRGPAPPVPVTPGEEAPPEAIGMSSRALERVDGILRRAIADSVTPGAALAVGRSGRLVRLRGYGRLDWGAGAPAVTDSTLFDLASLTKAVGTTSAVMLLVEEGRMELADPLGRHLPEWTGGWREGVTLRRLLAHRAGLPAFLPLWREHRGREEFRRALADLGPVHPPGSRTLYGDPGFLLLGLAVEEAAGVPLDGFLRTRLFGPLGMSDTGFRPEPRLRDRVAPTEVDTLYRGRHVHGEVHDENAHAMGGVAGHAGLFSSVRDLAAFARLLAEGGALPGCGPDGAGAGVDAAAPGPEADRPGGADGGAGPFPGGRPCARGAREPVRIFRPETVAAFTTRLTPESGRALGWDVPDADPGPEGEREAAPEGGAPPFSPRAFGHTGFTGTSLWVDPALDLYVVLLTSRLNPTRENRGHVPLRRAVHRAVVRAVGAAP